MNLGTKRQLSRITLYILMLVVSLFLVGTVVLIACAGLHVNPFREDTSTFLGAVFAGLIGVAFATLFLNVATNLSLIAEARAVDLNVEPASRSLRPWFVWVAGASAALTVLVVAGAKISEHRFLAAVRREAEQLTSSNTELLAKAAAAVKSGQPRDLDAAADILRFLESQRRDLPEVSVVYASTFQGRRALHVLTSSRSEDDDKADASYFECEQGFDCEYLDRFFSDGQAGALQKLVQPNTYVVYVPWTRDGARLLLRFGRYQRYGSFGS